MCKKMTFYYFYFAFPFSRKGISYSLLIHAGHRRSDGRYYNEVFFVYRKNCVHDFLIMFDSFIIKKCMPPLELLFAIYLRAEVDLFCHQAELILLELVTETFLASFAVAVQ